MEYSHQLYLSSEYSLLERGFLHCRNGGILRTQMLVIIADLRLMGQWLDLPINLSMDYSLSFKLLSKSQELKVFSGLMLAKLSSLIFLLYLLTRLIYGCNSSISGSLWILLPMIGSCFTLLSLLNFLTTTEIFFCLLFSFSSLFNV